MPHSTTLASAQASTTPPPSYERRNGEIVDNRYELLRPLGRGGMGEVWIARDRTLDADVAVKFLSREMDYDLAEQLRARFRFEAQVSALLARATEHVVRVHDAGKDGDAPYLVMEYVPGRSLEKLIEECGALVPAHFCEIFDRLCEALDAAHAHGVLHRDLKPGNVMLGADGLGKPIVKLGDFGIAKGGLLHLPLDRPKQTREGFLVGSPDYMAPEQFIGLGTSDPRSDRWSLGVLAYEALTGRLPFDGRSIGDTIANIATGRYTRASVWAPQLPAGIDTWFATALAQDPEQRFQSAGEMATTLRELVEGRKSRRPSRPGVSERVPAPVRPARPRAASFVALGATAVVGAAIALAVWSSRTPAETSAPEAFPAATAAAPPAEQPALPAPPVEEPSVARAAPAPSSKADEAPSRVVESAAPGPRAPSAVPRSVPRRPVDPNPSEPSAIF